LAASTNAVLKHLGALLGITTLVMVFAWINLHQVSLRGDVSLGITAFHWAFAVAAVIGAVNLLVNLLPRRLS
jgi:hypothetical protein